MQIDKIKLDLNEALSCTHLDVSSDGNHIKLVIVSSEFEGLSAVKKQQRVYAILQASIASGEIHAVHMKTLTPAEWEAQN